VINVGLIGFGYWGPNLARNFNNSSEMNLVAICDFSDDRLKMAGRLYPQVTLTKRSEDIFDDSKIDAVAIATPVSTHYKLARKALLSGKHVWLEKPMTENVEQGESLISLANEQGRVLLVDHTFVYTGAVRKIKELIDRDELGDLIYYDSTRANLGLFQQDVDVIWDLAPHDLSIMDFLMPYKKMSVSAVGSHFYGNGIVPKAVLTINMEKDIVAYINVSWVSPVKIRDTFIAGTSKMILYDDTHPSEKVKVYDKGVDIYETKEELYHLNVQYRVGDMYAPKLDDREALARETGHFADCVNNGKTPVTDGKAGLEVVKILVAAKQSISENGTPVNIT